MCFSNQRHHLRQANSHQVVLIENCLTGPAHERSGVHLYMTHKTGFTSASLGLRIVDAGFPIVVVKREGFDLWALGLMHEADQTSIQRRLVAAGLVLFEQADESI